MKVFSPREAMTISAGVRVCTDNRVTVGAIDGAA
jgi:hypothetical protein